MEIGLGKDHIKTKYVIHKGGEYLAKPHMPGCDYEFRDFTRDFGAVYAANVALFNQLEAAQNTIMDELVDLNKDFKITYENDDFKFVKTIKFNRKKWWLLWLK